MEEDLVLFKDLTSFLYTLYEFHPDIGIDREGLISLLCLVCAKGSLQNRKKSVKL